MTLYGTHTRTQAGWTALHEAAERGWLQLVSYLITSGADVNFADQYGCTPLHVAVVSEHQHAAHIVMALLKANADPNAGDWVRCHTLGCEWRLLVLPCAEPSPPCMPC